MLAFLAHAALNAAAMPPNFWCTWPAYTNDGDPRGSEIHGTFGDVVVGTCQTGSNAELYLGTNLSTPLWVVEAIGNRTTAVAGKILRTWGSFTLVASESVPEPVSPATNVISVATSALRARRPPPRALLSSIRNHTGFGEPHPVITAALKDLSKDNMRDNLQQLTAIHSRQSNAGGAVEAEAWIAAEMIQLGFEVSTFFFQENMSSNVIGELVGTRNPQKVVIVGAHYDSRATGRSNTHPFHMRCVFTIISTLFEHPFF